MERGGGSKIRGFKWRPEREEKKKIFLGRKRRRDEL